MSIASSCPAIADRKSGSLHPQFGARICIRSSKFSDPRHFVAEVSTTLLGLDFAAGPKRLHNPILRHQSDGAVIPRPARVSESEPAKASAPSRSRRCSIFARSTTRPAPSRPAGFCPWCDRRHAWVATQRSRLPNTRADRRRSLCPPPIYGQSSAASFPLTQEPPRARRLDETPGV
jgi:hypothetical protein